MYGDVIISQSEQTTENGQQLFIHRIVRESNNQKLFLARTRWSSE
jgi:hypothetical protein